jgi:hypothetical protein
MFIVHTRSKTDRPFKKIIGGLKTGSRVLLGKAIETFPNFKPSRHGVVQYLEGDGFYTNGILTHPYNEKLRDWFPYQEEYVLIIVGDDISLLKTSGEIEKIITTNEVDTPQQHLYTEGVLVNEKNGIGTDSSWISPIIQTKSIRRAFEHLRHFEPLKLFQGPVTVSHTLSMPARYLPQVHMGHPLGPTFLQNNNVVVMDVVTTSGICTPTVIHTLKFAGSLYKEWLVCKEGFVDHTAPSVFPLSFNEDPDRVFFREERDKVVVTPSGCAVLHQHKVYLSSEPKEALAWIPYDSMDDVVSHPFGLLILHNRQFELLVVN